MDWVNGWATVLQGLGDTGMDWPGCGGLKPGLALAVTSDSPWERAERVEGIPSSYRASAELDDRHGVYKEACLCAQ